MMVLYIAAGLLFLGTGYSFLASALDRRRFPPTGRLVDVGGYRLHIKEMGEAAGPTVVLLSGRFNPSLFWTAVQGSVAAFARVVAYDRPGYAWSDPAGERSGERVVAELHTLLKRAEVPGPYLLVGHSLGAIYARLFAKAHPDEVAGLVLVDPYTEGEVLEQPERMARAQAGSNRQTWLLALLGLGRLLALAAPGLLDPGGLLRQFPAEVRRAALLFSTHARLWRAVCREWEQVGAMAAALRQAPGLGEIPLVVLSAGRQDFKSGGGFSEAEANAYWELAKRSQAAVAGFSTRGRLVMVPDCGHGMQLERTEVVVEAVREIYSAVVRRYS